MDSNGNKLANAVAMKLGRYGAEKMTSIAPVSQVQDGLTLAENAHQFNDGARYTDFNPSTDKSAAYGVAGLVAGVLGVKVLKGAGLVGLAVLLKKFALFLFLPFIWIWGKLTALFKKRPKSVPGA